MIPSRQRLQSQARAWALGSLFALALLAGRCAWGASAVWELTPYRVHALVAISPQAETSGVRGDALMASITARAATVVGPRWNFTIAAAVPPLSEQMILDFDHITVEQLAGVAPSDDCDKLLLLSIRGDCDDWSITAQELDVRTQLLGTRATQAVYSRARLVDAAFQSLLAAFSPLATVETVDVGKVTLLLRASEVPTRDLGLAQAQAGTIFRPVIRENDRQGKARLIQALDWTFLCAESVEATRVNARMVTGVRPPLATRKRGRREQLAVVVHPPHGSTVIEIRAADQAARPLSGCKIYSHPFDSKETELLGTTDPHGKLRIEPGDGSVRVLMVKSGDIVTARLPLLPGLLPHVEARVTDDERRLQVEGFITGFQEQFVDQLARRQVLISRVRSRMRAGKLDEARTLFAELRRMTTTQDFAQNLLVARQRLVSDDPRTQKQINKLFDDTQTIVSRFLSTRTVDDLERELAASGVPDAANDPKTGAAPSTTPPAAQPAQPPAAQPPGPPAVQPAGPPSVTR